MSASTSASRGRYAPSATASSASDTAVADPQTSGHTSATPTTGNIDGESSLRRLIGHYSCDERGRRLFVRNGACRDPHGLDRCRADRDRAHRVNDKRVDGETGVRVRFRSSIVPPWCRKSPKVAEVLPLMYLHGMPAATSSRRSRSKPIALCASDPPRARIPGGSPHAQADQTGHYAVVRPLASICDYGACSRPRNRRAFRRGAGRATQLKATTPPVLCRQ